MYGGIVVCMTQKFGMYETIREVKCCDKECEVGNVYFYGCDAEALLSGRNIKGIVMLSNAVQVHASLVRRDLSG